MEKNLPNVTQADLARTIPRDPILLVSSWMNCQILSEQLCFSKIPTEGQTKLISLGLPWISPPQPAVIVTSIQVELEISRSPKKHAISMSPPGGHETMFAFVSWGVLDLRFNSLTPKTGRMGYTVASLGRMAFVRTNRRPSMQLERSTLWWQIHRLVPWWCQSVR